jgi:hypothetical protein
MALESSGIGFEYRMKREIYLCGVNTSGFVSVAGATPPFIFRVV